MDIKINAAKEIADEYGWPVVVIFAADYDGQQHVTTYGTTNLDSKNAAKAGNNLKKSLGWPENLCQSVPVERICENCRFYDPDYGIHCFNGWSGDGSSGWCLVEPGKEKREGKNVACRFFEGRGWR